MEEEEEKENTPTHASECCSPSGTIASDTQKVSSAYGEDLPANAGRQ